MRYYNSERGRNHRQTSDVLADELQDYDCIAAYL